MAKVIGKQFAEGKYLNPSNPPKLTQDSGGGGGSFVAAEVPGGSGASSVPVMLGATNKVHYLYSSENYSPCRTSYSTLGCRVEHDGCVEFEWGAGSVPEVGRVRWVGNGKASGHRSVVINGTVEADLFGSESCCVAGGDMAGIMGDARGFITSALQKTMACVAEKIDPETLNARWTESYSIEDPGAIISGVRLDEGTWTLDTNSHVFSTVDLMSEVYGYCYGGSTSSGPYVDVSTTVLGCADVRHRVQETMTFPTVRPGARVTLAGVMPISVTIDAESGDCGGGQQGSLTFCVPRVRAYELRSSYADGGFCNTMYDSDVWTFNEITNDIVVKYDCEHVVVKRIDGLDCTETVTELGVKAMVTVPVPDSRVVVLTTDAGDVFNETKRIAECEILGWGLCASSSDRSESRRLGGGVAVSVGLGDFEFVNFSQ